MGLNYGKIRNTMRYGYKRNNFIPMLFASGPCLSKDTMQLSSFFNHKFLLGKIAMKINHGCQILSLIIKKFNLKKKNWSFRIII